MRLVEWQTAFPRRNHVSERRPLDQLHHDRAHLAGVFEAVHVRDVGVVQGGQHLGFTGKARQPIGIVGDGGEQHLERHVALQLRVTRPVHLAHAARSEGCQDLVGAESCAGSEAHWEVPAAILTRPNFEPFP